MEVIYMVKRFIGKVFKVLLMMEVLMNFFKNKKMYTEM